jgi:hypothetical protein
MATANLTKRVIDSLEFSPNCDYFVWDAKLKGFGVRITERAAIDGKRSSLVTAHVEAINSAAYLSAYLDP